MDEAIADKIGHQKTIIITINNRHKLTLHLILVRPILATAILGADIALTREHSSNLPKLKLLVTNIMLVQI